MKPEMKQRKFLSKLATLINMLSMNGNINIVDFGGNLGTMYMAIERSFLHPNRIDWYVVDVKKIVEYAKKRVEDKINLHFTTDIKSIKSFDIFFCHNSLNFIEDYKKLLSDISKNKTLKIIFLSGVPAGDNIEYITLMKLNHTEKGLPTIFFNRNDLVKYVESLGFSLFDESTQKGKLDIPFKDIKYHLDKDRKNYLKGYIFKRGD